MGQTPKDLEPSASPLHFFGAEVRRLRLLSGLSQADLGVRLMHSKDLVGKVEAALRMPSRDFVERCDEILTADGMLRRLWPMLERENRLRNSHQLSTSNRGKGFHPEATDRPVLDWLLATTEETHPDGTDDVMVAGAADKLQQMRAADHSHGAGENYPDVSDYVRRRLRPLADQAPHIAVGFLELAGYEAVDLGADGTAQQHYLHALRVATTRGERLYGGYLIGVSLAHLALHCGVAEQAVRLATAALRGTADRATPAVRAAFRVVLARGHARLGNQVACFAALRSVERDLACSTPADEPQWIGYFGEADLADEKAHCFFDLGQHQLAQREVTAALALMESSRVRRLAIDTALYASSLARSGGIDEAAVVARAAVDHAASTASFRSAHRIALMLGELQPYAGVQPVRELADYVRARFPIVPTISER